MAGSAAEVMEATDGFVTDIDGERYIVNRGTTRVAANHILVQRYPNMFRSVSEGLSFTEETADVTPGEQRERPAATVSATATRGRAKSSANQPGTAQGE
jgi:hypothetical protein